MTSIVFDTLEYARAAEKAGFTKAQAEFQAHEFAKLINENLATKQDLKDLKKDLIIWIGSIIVVAVGLLPNISKLVSLI